MAILHGAYLLLIIGTLLVCFAGLIMWWKQIECVMLTRAGHCGVVLLQRPRTYIFWGIITLVLRLVWESASMQSNWYMETIQSTQRQVCCLVPNVAYRGTCQDKHLRILQLLNTTHALTHNTASFSVLYLQTSSTKWLIFYFLDLRMMSLWVL